VKSISETYITEEEEEDNGKKKEWSKPRVEEGRKMVMEDLEKKAMKCYI